MRSVTPSVVSANVDAVLSWFHAVVPSDNINIIVSVLTGVIEIQEIEDRIEGGRQIILEFCEEEQTFLNELGYDPPDTVRSVLALFSKTWHDQSSRICSI
jgi:hypothetical protein